VAIAAGTELEGKAADARETSFARFARDASCGLRQLDEYLVKQKEYAGLMGSAPNAIKLAAAATRAQTQLEAFVNECVELFWLMQLSVPRIGLDTATSAEQAVVSGFTTHMLIPQHLAAAGPVYGSVTIFFSPLRALADSSVLVRGVGI
jgi:hypothetical protein